MEAGGRQKERWVVKEQGPVTKETEPEGRAGMELGRQGWGSKRWRQSESQEVHTHTHTLQDTFFHFNCDISSDAG